MPTWGSEYNEKDRRQAYLDRRNKLAKRYPNLSVKELNHVMRKKIKFSYQFA